MLYVIFLCFCVFVYALNNEIIIVFLCSTYFIDNFICLVPLVCMFGVVGKSQRKLRTQRKNAQKLRHVILHVTYSRKQIIFKTSHGHTQCNSYTHVHYNNNNLIYSIVSEAQFAF